MRLTVASKGFGAENMSALRMFTPADGTPAVKQFVVDTIDRAGANACPPVVVGVGIGGTFEMAALLAKKRSCARSTPAIHAPTPPRSSRNCSTRSTASESARRAWEAR